MADAIYVGAGTYSAGNNASVTPGLPSGLQDGDLLLLITSIRDAAGSANTPSGWTLAGSAVGTTAAGFHKLFTREYTTGVTAPTVTFTGGGSNDTTQGIILAFRGARTAGTILVQEGIYGEIPNTGVNYSSYAQDPTNPPVQAGEYLIQLRTTDNDSAISIAPSMLGTGSLGNPTSQTYIHNTSTLGADASMTISLGIAPTSLPSGGSWYTLQTGYTTAADVGGVTAWHIINAKIATVAGSGGSLVSGSADIVVRNTTVSQTGTLGALAGGSAQATYSQSSTAMAGTGGAAIGGSAGVSLLNVESLNTGTGGCRVGGSAAILVIHPTQWHIDPVYGSNSNGGTSWIDAFATFAPLEAGGAYLLEAGDTVKIAKTPEPIDTGVSFPNICLQSTSDYSGYTYNQLYALPSALNANIKLVAELKGSTGWSNIDGAKSSFGEEGPTTYPWLSGNNNWFYIYCTALGYAANVLLAYYPLAATLNLSAFTRLELGLEMRRGSDTYDAAHVSYVLRLCSDAAGVTPLLSIPLVLSKIKGRVFAYTGPLPNGVNSISIATGPNSVGDAWRFSMNTLIACKAYTDPSYVGLFTAYRFGSHEAAQWALPIRYTETEGQTYVAFLTSFAGPAALNNTSWSFWTRTVTAFDTIGDRSSSFTGDTYLNAGYNRALRTLINTYKIKPAFNLLDIQGDVSEDIYIVGGWDPATDTVTGRTSIMVRPAATPQHAGLSAIALGNTKYVAMSSIDITTFLSSGWVFTGESIGLTYIDMDIHCALVPELATAGVDTFRRTYNDSTMTVNGLYFKNCKGAIYPNGTRNATNGALYRLPVTGILGVVMEDCVLTPYMYPTPSYLLNNPAPAPITLVGTLKVYCAARVPTLNAEIGATGTLTLPPIASGSSGVLYVYGSGAIGVPSGPAYTQFSGTYIFPKMVFENGVPVFYTQNDLFGDTYAGRAEALILPEITLNFTGTVWDSRGVGTPTDYHTSTLLGFDDIPPIQIEKLTHTGNIIAGNSGSVTYLLQCVATDPVFVGIKNMAMSSGAWKYVMPTFYKLPRFSTPSGPPLLILDTITNLARDYGNLYLFSSSSSIGYLDFRNTQWTNTSINYACEWGHTGTYGAFVCYRNCVLSNANGAAGFATFPAVAWSMNPTYYQGAGAEAGIALVDTTAVLNPSAIINDTTFATLSEYYLYNIGTDERSSIGVINTSTGAHTVYAPGRVLSKDYATYHTSPFSWKSTLRFNVVEPLSNTYPIGSYPIKQGRIVTITLWVKLNSISNNRIGLVVHHDGCAGYALPQDLTEKMAFSSGINTSWEQISVQFTAQRTGMIEVHASHYGAFGSIAWYDDIRIVEQ